MVQLTKAEKQFLSNKKGMDKRFGAFAAPACVAYEYCRAYEAEKPLLERFGQVRLKFLSGCVKKSATQNSARVKICNTNLGKLTSTRLSVQKNQKNQKNSEKSQKNRTNSSQKSGFEVRFSDPYDMIEWRKIIYHEMAHNLIKKTVRELDRVLTRRAWDGKRKAGADKEMICFSGVDPIYSYVVDKRGRATRVIWRNLPLKMLEEGVAENIAIKCVENECALGDSPLFFVADETNFTNKIQGKITHYMGYSLVGLWDCVSNNSLIREHLTGACDEGELAEATEIFKNKFVDFAQLVVGKNEKNATPQNYDSGKMREIAGKYSHCVDFCKKRYLLLFGVCEQDENLRDFGGFVETASDVPNVVRNLSKYINMTAREREETREIFNKALRLNAWQIEKQKARDVEQQGREFDLVLAGADRCANDASAEAKSVDFGQIKEQKLTEKRLTTDNFDNYADDFDAVEFDKFVDKRGKCDYENRRGAREFDGKMRRMN